MRRTSSSAAVDRFLSDEVSRGASSILISVPGLAGASLQFPLLAAGSSCAVIRFRVGRWSLGCSDADAIACSASRSVPSKCSVSKGGCFGSVFTSITRAGFVYFNRGRDFLWKRKAPHLLLSCTSLPVGYLSSILINRGAGGGGRT